MANDSSGVGNQNFYLDTFGYASLAGQNPRIDLFAMQCMYDQFLPSGDPIISRVMQEATLAKNQIMQYQQKKAIWEAASEDKGGKHHSQR